MIARLYWEKVGKEWRESSDKQRECNALCQLYDNYDEHALRIRNRLEAKLQRHWPELPQHLGAKSITLEQLLIEYGSPAKMMDDEKKARALIQKISRGHLSQEKIEGVLEASKQSIGVPCIEMECWQLQQLGEDLQHVRLKKKAIKQKLEALVENDPELSLIGEVVGKVTTAMLLSNRLDPRDYSSTGAYLKAIGLNLKEKSSGQHKGQLKITKRGSGQARKYLYLAVLRLVRLNPVMKRWYQNKLRQHGQKNKNRWLIALMRKLTMGLWNVGRGSRFDANKLFNMKGVA